MFDTNKNLGQVVPIGMTAYLTCRNFRAALSGTHTDRCPLQQPPTKFTAVSVLPAPHGGLFGSPAADRSTAAGTSPAADRSTADGASPAADRRLLPAAAASRAGTHGRRAPPVDARPPTLTAVTSTPRDK